MSKVMTMKEAIATYVKSGLTIFISGMQHGEPSAAVHEIARQKIDHLTVIGCLVATIWSAALYSISALSALISPLPPIR